MGSSILTHIDVPVLGSVMAEMAINCIVVSLVLITVSLRVYDRHTGPGLGWDDYMVIIATPMGIAMLVCQGLILPTGGGYELASNSQLIQNVPFIFLMSFCMEVVYVPCLAAAKASMLLFYKRVFSTDYMQTVVNITLGILALWTIAFECACIFLCNPVSDFWGTQASCGAFVPMIQSLIATNALGDLIVMCLPMRLVWSLQMRTGEKLGIMACFALGSACIVIAVFRVIYLAKVDLAANITGTMPPTVFLFVLEPNLAILCVSIPMLRPMYTRYKGRNSSSRLYDGGGSDSNGQPIRTFGQGTTPAARKGGSKGRGGGGAGDDPNGWEMDDYYSTEAARGHINSTAVVGTADAADFLDASSEKGLTAMTTTGPPSEEHAVRAANAIAVETKWTVTRT